MAHILGRPIDRIDGSLKVTGTALYAGDNRLERMAFGWIVPASIARGRIVSIDAANARRILVGHHQEHAGHAPCRGGIDAGDAAARDARRHDPAEGHAL